MSPEETSLQDRPSIFRGFGGEATTLQPMPTYYKSYPSTMSRDLQHVPREIILKGTLVEKKNLHTSKKLNFIDPGMSNF